MTEETAREAPIAGASRPFKTIVKPKRLDADTYRAWGSWPLEEKHCADCERTLSISQFWVKTHWISCDAPRTWSTWCKSCQRERRRFYARQKRRMEGIPERKNGPYKGRHKTLEELPYSHTSSYDERVPASPFTTWLKKWIATEDRDDALTSLSLAAGVDVERLRKFATREDFQKNVTIGFVDRILVASGTSTALWELLPDDH